MLPSSEVAGLAKRVVLVAVRTRDEAAEEFRLEFDMPPSMRLRRNCWIVVLDGRGEALGRLSADRVGGDCTKESVSEFPAEVVKAVDACLKRTESTESLRKRFLADPVDEAAYQAVLRRYEEASSLPALSAACASAADEPERKTEARAMLSRRAFILSSETLVEAGWEERSKRIREGERLLVEGPDHALADGVVRGLAKSLEYGFDIPEKSRQMLERLNGAAAGSDALKGRIEALSRLISERISNLESEQKRLKARARPPKQALGVIAAQLGNAEETLRVFDADEYRLHDLWKGWVREAQEKLKGAAPRQGESQD